MYFPYSFWSGFSPLDISGILFWFKADSGIVLNGADVSAIADQTGIPLGGPGTKTLSQPVAARQPFYNTTGLLGRPTIEFTKANNDALWNPLNGWTIPGGFTTTFSFFFVAKSTSVDGTQMVWGGVDTGQPASRWGIGIGTADSGWYGTSATTFLPIVYPINTFISRSYIKSSIDWNIYQNGTLSVAAVADTAGISAFTPQFCIGNEGDNAPYGVQGSVVEVIGYQVALGNADRVRVEQYLRAKYLLY